MNDNDIRIILCPSCKQPGILHLDQRQAPRVTDYLVASVEHAVENPETHRLLRYNCMLRAHHLDQIEAERRRDDRRE